ncbi:MAG: N-acetylmuramoyl-L-alanine amidase [Anaerolineae bacterium]
MSLIRRSVLRGTQHVLLALLVMIALAVITIGARAIWGRERSSSAASITPGLATSALSGTVTNLQTPAATARPTRGSLFGRFLSTPAPPIDAKVGIVAGHWESDVGAVCPDGLTEVEINLAVAQQVVDALSRAGYEAEMLTEFSPKLHGYEADALVSIHTDSCNVPEASGFKVARVDSSLVPEREDRLVACLIENYQAATGLPFHENSITYDMTEYHAFFEIAAETPGAIIEVGFMDADRRLLTRRQDLVAKGIVDGIRQFVEETQ